MPSATPAERLLDAICDPLHPGLRVQQTGSGEVTLYLPLSESFIGNPWNGYVHGGVLTNLLDKATRAAALGCLDTGEDVLPLDLRIDHLAATRATEGLVARARCTRLTATIAFVEGEVVDAHSDAVVANGVTSLLRTWPEESVA